MSFYSELKRRNVIRVAAAYAVAAWLLIQVADTTFPLFGFDKQPDRAEIGICCGGIVPLSSVMDWQGPYYYLRGNFHWD